MKAKPNIHPFIDRIKEEPVPELRVNIAMKYIDLTIREFEIYGHGMNGNQLLKYFQACREHWNKLVRKEIPMSSPDEDGLVDYLPFEMYEELYGQRALALAPNLERFEELRLALTGIYATLGWTMDVIENAEFEEKE